MNKINVHFEHCYGIKKLKHEFNFKERVFAIYASNGVMKTSFAKTFKDHSKENTTKDLVFPERKTVREISIGDEATPDPKNIFVIEPCPATTIITGRRQL